MCTMTERAVFGSGLVLPQKRAAFFGMTAVTGIVERRAYQAGIRAAAVRTVTVGALHAPLLQWVRKRQPRLGLLCAMAGKANLVLHRPNTHRIAHRMRAMAVGATQALPFVRAADPSMRHSGAMAFETRAILRCNRCSRSLRTEQRNCRAILAAAHARGMRSARSVTGFALQLTMSEWRALIGATAVWRLENRENCRLVMTSNTGVGAFATVARRRRNAARSLGLARCIGLRIADDRRR